MTSSGVPGWQRQAELVRSEASRLLGEPIGVYVHGSAALGGWTAASDLDILVVASPDSDLDWSQVATGILRAADPTPVIELSIVDAASARAPQSPWPYFVHVAQSDQRVVRDDGSGDADLLMHYVVTREYGITLSGADAKSTFGVVPRAAVLDYLDHELEWGLENADSRYAVLNACRAAAYALDGTVLSKVAGGEWALARNWNPAVVEPALTAQLEGRDLGRPTPLVRELIQEVQALLRG